MERNSGKVMVACAIGAGIGSMIALELNAYLWWLGTLVGFMAGYLAYDFHKVIQAIPQAWQSAKNCLSWRPDDEFKIHSKITIKAFVQIFFGMFCLFLSVGIAMLGLSAISGDSLTFDDLFIYLCIISVLALLISSLFTIIETPDSDFKALERSGKDALFLIKHLNPISLYFYWLPKGIILGSIWLCVTGIPKAFDFLASVVVAAGVFCKQLFILITL